MATTNVSALQLFLDKCSTGILDDSYKFLRDGCRGHFSHSTGYDNTESSKHITQLNSWKSKCMPKNFPVEATGTFFYLISKNSVDGQADRQILSEDWLSPWDKAKKAVTKWTKTKQTTGEFLNIGRSRHHEHRNYYRYISYLSTKNGVRTSDILYQYVVERETCVRRSSGVATRYQKRKALAIDETEVPYKTKRRTTKKSKDSTSDEVVVPPAFQMSSSDESASEFCVEELPTDDTPLFHNVKEEPLDELDSFAIPAPPPTESRIQNETALTCNVQTAQAPEVQPAPALQPEQVINPCIFNAHDSFNVIENAKEMLKNQYIASNSKEEMRMFNAKIMKLFSIELELKKAIDEAAEKARREVEERIFGTDKGKNPNGVVVKTEVIDI